MGSEMCIRDSIMATVTASGIPEAIVAAILVAIIGKVLINIVKIA